MSVNEQIVSSLTSGVIAVDADARVLAVNEAACKHLGQLPEVLREGSSLQDLQPSDPLLNLFEEIKSTNAPVNRRELVWKHSDASTRLLGVSVSLLDGAAPFNGAIFLFSDMTRWRELERVAEFNRQLAALGELTAGVVHEVRNPLGVITGMAELLLRRVEDERCRKYAQTIFKEAEELEKSIGQFLGFARPFELDMRFCSAEDIINRMEELTQRRAMKKAVTIEVTRDYPVAVLHVDLIKTAQALTNLVNNAIDATPREGTVQMRAYRDGEDVVFEVLDQGPGVHIEPDENLFSPFVSRKKNGTGIGLAIVQRIVTAHHGDVSYSNCPDGGARFEMRLPVGRGDD